MTGLYHYPPTWLHKLPAGFKLFMLAILSALALHIESAIYLTATLAFACLFFLVLGAKVFRRLLLLKPLWPIIAAVFFAQWYIGGLPAGIASVARLALMILLADLVTMSTPMQALMDAISWLLKPLRHTGLDFMRLSFCIALVIRLVPLLLETWQKHAEAWRARTGRRANWRIIAPFISNVLRIADHMGDSLDARGYGMQSSAASLERQR